MFNIFDELSRIINQRRIEENKYIRKCKEKNMTRDGEFKYENFCLMFLGRIFLKRKQKLRFFQTKKTTNLKL